MNFQKAGPDTLATTGDFVLIAKEVNPVISALAEHNIEVTALHSHMLNEGAAPVFHALLGNRKPRVSGGGH